LNHHWTRSLSHAFSVFGLIACGSQIALAAVPPVVADGQIALASGLGYPQGVAVSNNGTVFVADTANNRIVTISSAGVVSPVNIPGYTLRSPGAVAVDPVGDIYIADSNNVRVLEVPVSGSPTVIADALTLSAPIAVAVDPEGNVYIGDGNKAAVYEVKTGGSAQKVNIPNVSSLFPQALVTDGSGNLYIADGNSNNIYEVASGGGAAQNVTPSGFTLNSPTGVAFDAAGDFFVLDGANSRVIEVPGADTSHPYQVPITGLSAASGLALDPAGDLYVTDVGNNNVTELVYASNAINLGQVSVGGTGTPAAINYELNAPETLTAFHVSMQGDAAAEASLASGTTCQLQSYADSPSGSGNPITAANPFNCVATVQGVPAYPGIRNGAINLLGSSSTPLLTVPFTETGTGAAAWIVPGVANSVVSTLSEPQGFAISAENGTVYIADVASALVYSWKGLNGTSSAPTAVSTSPVTLSYPVDVKVDGAGDLFIADYGLGNIVVVPSNTAIQPHILATGSFIGHPLALAMDASGNLFISDGGPTGDMGNNSQPAFVVKVPPAGGPISVLNTSAANVYFPQTLATDAAGNLYIADGGPTSAGGNTGPGQVVFVPRDGSAASVLNIPGLIDPVGLAFDPAGQLWILDYGNLNQFTILPPNGGTIYTVPLIAPLVNPSEMAFTAGPNALLISDLGSGLNLVSGSQTQLTFPQTTVNAQSTAQNAAVFSIGNAALKQASSASAPYSYSGNTQDFLVQSSSACFDFTQLAAPQSCFSATFAPIEAGAEAESITSNFNTATQVQLSLTGTTPNASSVTASPTFSPASGTFSTAQTVTLSDATSGAVIHYTTDGTTPTTSSAVYSTAITISASTTLKALAVAPGYAQSPVASATYAIQSGGSSAINFAAGFSSATGLQLNGVTKVNSDNLELTDGGGYEAGSAFWTTPVNVQAFTTNFTFQLSSAVADGFTFTIQNTGATALGSYGGGLGYGINPNGGTSGGIGESVAIKFDIYSNSGEGSDSTGIFTDGASPTNPAVDLTSSGIVLSSGDTMSVQLVYDGTTLTLNLTDTVTNKTFTHAFTIDIPSTVGGNTAYVGFTGGTGGSTAVQNIKSWTFTAGTTQAAAEPVFNPMPGTYTLAQNVSLSSATTGATIYYTTDGTIPSTTSTVYSTAITISASTTLKALAVAPGYAQSPVASAAYMIQSATVNFAGGFPSTTGLQLNGVTKANSDNLELTDGGGYEAGSAFWTTPVNIQAFTTNFTFQLSSAVADGFTFTIQNTGATALGSYGGGLGYGINPNGGTSGGIGESVTIKFDIYSNSGEGSDSTGVFTNGASPTNPAVDLTSSGIVLSSGDTMSVQLVYDGTTLTINLTDTVTNKTFTYAFTVNIPSIVGANTAYVGFTGGTGGATAVQNIKTWTFTTGTT
jgi:sugar lactone lactonase YvrE